MTVGMNVSIGKNLETYVEWQLKNGPFNSASEIVRDALRMHQAKYASHYQNAINSEELERWEREFGTSKDKARRA